jgi:hypothetical protein
MKRIVPSLPTRADVVKDYQEAFDRIGGASRLALWADGNPGDFYKLHSRLLPPSSHPDMDDAGVIEVIHRLPTRSLKREDRGG